MVGPVVRETSEPGLPENALLFTSICAENLRRALKIKKRATLYSLSESRLVISWVKNRIFSEIPRLF